MVCPTVKRLCALSPVCSRLSAVLFPAVKSQEDNKHSPPVLPSQHLRIRIQQLLGSSERDLGTVFRSLILSSLIPYRQGGTTPLGAPSPLVLTEFWQRNDVGALPCYARLCCRRIVAHAISAPLMHHPSSIQHPSAR